MKTASHPPGLRLSACWGWIGLMAAAFAQEPLPLAFLEDSLRQDGTGIRSFLLEGTVREISADRTLVALQDDSAAVLLRLPPLDHHIARGDGLRLQADACLVALGPLAIEVGTGPVVELDGRHSVDTKSGKVFLPAGPQPVRIEWFNGHALAELALEYEGPGIDRQPVPAPRWRRKRGGGFQPGLDFSAYTGEGWHALPDFRALPPVATGTASFPDLRLRPRPTDVGMVFSGFLEIPRAGIYTFHLLSDDGSRLFIGEPALNIARLTLPPSPAPDPAHFGEIAAPMPNSAWVTAEGKVTFAAVRNGLLHLELLERGNPVSLVAADFENFPPGAWLHRSIRATGVAVHGAGGPHPLSASLTVIGSGRLETVHSPAADGGDEPLATAIQVRRLQPEEANRPFRASLRGVVTTATVFNFVLQDHTGGVFVQYTAERAADQPRPGELWEIEGDTHPGRFSPIVVAHRAARLGPASLPEPVKPTWEQLMSGSLDAEQVEIEGIVLSASPSQVSLLTRDGQVLVHNREQAPLPHLSFSLPDQTALPGAKVRLRGVFTASWDLYTGLVIAGEFSLGNAMLSIDEPAPADPFATPLLRIEDLRRFTSHAHALKRVKVSGRILHIDGREGFLQDGGKGLRFTLPDAAPFRPGDEVEVVGFPRLGGPSPLLLEARARQTGTAVLPAPLPLDPARLPDPSLDSTLVRIDARLLSDTIRRDERLLEMQAGTHRFFARLKHSGSPPKSLHRESLLRLTGVYAAARTDGPWNDAGAFGLLLGRPRDLDVLQPGPWWSARHTIAAIALLSGGLAVALVWVTLLRRTVAQRTAQLAAEIEERQRAEQHRAIEKERTRVAQDLHDELGSGLTEAGILSELAKNPAIPGARKESYLDQLSALCRSLVTGLDEIVWAVNPRYDSVSDLAGYCSLFSQRFLHLAGIGCRLEIDDAIPGFPLDSHLRHEVFLAFKEALNNVVRHSRADTVTLAIRVAGGNLNLSIADNGKGIAPDAGRADDNGLAGMKRRMQKLGGTCRIASSPSGGALVEFNLPIEASPS